MFLSRPRAALAILLLGLAHGASAEPFATGEVALVTDKGRFVIAVEMATTAAQRTRGLQGRRQLAVGSGMLFDFKRSQRVSMWMKNTPIPLDMLFVATDRRIVTIARRTTPFSLTTIPSGEPVRWVLEIDAGAADRLGIKVGDRLIPPK